MSWFLRKALPYATVTLHVSEYADSTNPQVYHIDVDQVITGGITGSKEARQLDWQEREHVDNIFGTLRGKSRFLRGSKADDGKVRPAVDFQTKVGDAEKDTKVQRFLRGEVLLDGAATEGFVVDDEGAEFGEGEGLWMQSFVVNEQNGWTAEQVRAISTLRRGPVSPDSVMPFTCDAFACDIAGKEYADPHFFTFLDLGLRGY